MSFAGSKRSLSSIALGLLIKTAAAAAPGDAFYLACTQAPQGSEALSTARALLTVAASSSCAETRDWLATQKRLQLYERELVDLAPLADLTELEELELGENRIRDVTPLAGLASLRWLALDDNYVEDLTPLARIVGLQELFLRRNAIRDLSPLASLASLGALALEGNPVVRGPESCPTDTPNQALNAYCAGD